MSFTIVPAFVDTNILVYAEDRDAGSKHTIAKNLASTLKVSFWDALMIQAARAARCDRLWTEDLNHGQRIGDLVILNPFLPSDSQATR